jgi:hypothetical protein
MHRAVNSGYIGSKPIVPAKLAPSSKGVGFLPFKEEVRVQVSLGSQTCSISEMDITLLYERRITDSTSVLSANFALISFLKKDMIGDRLKVGREALVLTIWVRILVPEPICYLRIYKYSGL